MGTPRIVEVVARYGDAVVAARRVGGEAPSSRPLLVGAGLVAVGLALAVAEIAARGTDVMLPVDGVGVGVGLSLFGLVLASIGLHRRAEPDASAFWVGQRDDVDLAALVPGLPADDRLPLVRRAGDGIELRFVPGMTGTLVRGGDPITLAAIVDEGPARAGTDGTFAVPFVDIDRATLRLGDIDLTIDPADGVPSPSRARLLDGKLAVATLFAAALVTGTIALAHHFVPEARTLPDQDDRPAALPERPEHPGTFHYPPRSRSRSESRPEPEPKR